MFILLSESEVKCPDDDKPSKSNCYVKNQSANRRNNRCCSLRQKRWCLTVLDPARNPVGVSNEREQRSERDISDSLDAPLVFHGERAMTANVV